MLAIAASDPTSGAGVTSDVKTATSFGVYCTVAVTGITVQDTASVSRSVPVDPELVYEQIQAAAADIPPAAVKIGLVPSAATARAILRAIDCCGLRSIVLDPVAVASSGGNLAGADGHTEALRALMARCMLVTPNYPEMEVLLGHPFADPVAASGELIERFGVEAVCLKGGHAPESDGIVTDTLVERNGNVDVFRHRRIDTRNSHGTGCAFSSAIAASLAAGFDLHNAVGRASAFVAALLEASASERLGHGSGCMAHHVLDTQKIMEI